MKKIFLFSLLLMSVVFGKSVEEIQNDWQQRHSEAMQEQYETYWQNEEVATLMPHCQGGDNSACRKLSKEAKKSCQNGLVALCAWLAQAYLQGSEQSDIDVDIEKAKGYANKVCKLDATFCASMSGLFMFKNRKVALKYAEKACEMGEMADCVFAAELWAVGFGGIGRNPQKVKYYSDKLCKAGLKEACE